MSGERRNGQPLHQGTRYPSPVVKVLALGWHDGPTDGILQCEPGGAVFKFDLLDEVRQWPTEEQDLRVFSLAPLPATAVGELEAAYAPYFPLRWPVCAPVWNFPTAADRTAIDRLTDQVLQQAGPVTWVVAACDLLGEILAARPVTPEEVARVADWPAFLGLQRGSALPG
jgi:hypothetical protein